MAGGVTNAEVKALRAERRDHPPLDTTRWARSTASRSDLRPFYFGACGFTPTNAGLISLTDQ